MSGTITIPTSVTCMENVKITILGQNHFFRSVLNSHLLLQLFISNYFIFVAFDSILYFPIILCGCGLLTLNTPQPLIMSQKPTKQERPPSCFQHKDEKMKAKMAEQTVDPIVLLVAMVARLHSQYMASTW